MSNLKLENHQKVAINFILKMKKVGLFLDMGLGKTLITLIALLNAKHRKDLTKHVLIVAPKNIALSTWESEIEKWNFPFKIKSLIVNEKGKPLSAQKRLEKYSQIKNEEPSIYIINRELVSNLVNYLENNKLINKRLFEAIVVDESQSFKGYKSSRFLSLKKITPFSKYVILLSGTPAPNSYEDLFSQIYLLDNGKRLGKNISTYRNEFLTCISPKFFKYEANNRQKEVIINRISDITMSMKNDAIRHLLPELTHNIVNIKLSDEERTKYDEFKKNEIVSMIDKETGKVFEDIISKNSAILSAKLLQMASGFIYTNFDEQGNEVNQPIEINFHNKKIEALETILENVEGNVLIAYWFKAEREKIAKMLSETTYNYCVFDGNPEDIKKWNEGKYKVMLIQPMSAGHGLNLQHGGNHLVWYSLPFSLEAYAQTNARLYRQGQKNHVVIHYLIVENTMDERVVKILNGKEASMEKLMEGLKMECENTLK